MTAIKTKSTVPVTTINRVLRRIFVGNLTIG
jgi:hypothetical protein